MKVGVSSNTADLGVTEGVTEKGIRGWIWVIQSNL